MDKVFTAEAIEPDEPAKPKINGSFVEQLLSPLMLQRMMACGGGVLVLGFVGWLWSIGLFSNPVVVAVLIGAATLSVMGIGMAMVRFTRYQLAGNGLTLLAALAMPLNLWFYSAQGLITIEGGGHLWIPAAICCAIYAFVARVLRNPTFVYTLVGGIVLTGMLFLADQSIGRFWELLPPATLLVVTGWICIYAERLFPKEEGDFSQANFGAAFYRSGVVALVSGLAIVLGGQVSAIIGGELPFLQVPRLASDSFHKVWALSLIGGSAIVFAGEFLSRKSKTFLTAAITLSSWAVITILDLVSIQLQLPHVAIGLGLIIIANVLRDRHRANALIPDAPKSKPMVWTIPTAGLVVMAVCQFFSQYLVEPGHVLMASTGWIVVLQLAVTAVACFVTWLQAYERTSSEVALDGNPKGASSVFLCWSLINCTLATMSSFAVFQLSSLDVMALALLVVPVAAIAIARATKGTQARDAWLAAAELCLTTLLIGLGIMFAVGVAKTSAVHLSWCWILSTSAIIYFVRAAGTNYLPAWLFGFISAAVAASQALAMAGVGADYAVVLSPTLIGLLLAVVSAFGRDALHKDSLEIPGNAMVLGGSVLGIFFATARVLDDNATLAEVGLLAAQLVAITITGFLTQSRSWRLGFRAIGIANVLSLICVFNQYIDTHWIHRFELAAIVFGMTLLTIGHIGWYREGEEQDGNATLSLWFGSLFVTLPLAIGLIFYRSFEVQTDWNWMLFHEIAAVAAALGLLSAGMACRIRSTTFGGVVLMTAYLGSVLALVRWPEQLQSVSVVMMIGGGVFFGTAVLLSMYRDRLVSLHKDMQEARGVFRVLHLR